MQALADATQRVVRVSSEVEATTVGAGLLALAGAGGRPTPEARLGSAQAPVEPGRALDRRAWTEAVGRARGWVEDLSTIDF